jgi:hypothetical protein
MNIPEFARQWKVSEKTIRRDLQAFAELERWVVREPGDPKGVDDERQHRWTYVFRYVKEYLFVQNVPPREPG